MLERIPGYRRTLIVTSSGALALLSIGAAAIARAAELVVVDQPDCPFCERFEREIAPAWPNTEEGRDVPLRRVNLREAWPSDLVGVEAPDLTPTFILVEHGVELGRLRGYRGDEHFWFLIGQLLEAREDPAGTADGAGRTDAAER